MESGRTTVFASILPQAGIAREIAGERMDIHVLVGKGQSPHTYEPTPRQMTSLSKTKTLLTIGVPFEKPLLKQIRRLYPELRIVETQKGIPLRQMHHTCTDHHSDETAHDDPHVWLNPRYAKTIASNICHEFSIIDPENKTFYENNLDQLLRKLDILDAELQKTLSPLNGKTFYVFHPSFGYFGDAYGLQQKSVEVEGKDPSPRQLAKLIEQARAENIRVVFVQQQFSSKSAKAIADAINGAVVSLDPLSENNLENLRHISQEIKKSFAHE